MPAVVLTADRWRRYLPVELIPSDTRASAESRQTDLPTSEVLHGRGCALDARGFRTSLRSACGHPCLRSASDGGLVPAEVRNSQELS
jgi:hypothetical protein